MREAVDLIAERAADEKGRQKHRRPEGPATGESERDRSDDRSAIALDEAVAGEGQRLGVMQSVGRDQPRADQRPVLTAEPVFPPMERTGEEIRQQPAEQRLPDQREEDHRHGP